MFRITLAIYSLLLSLRVILCAVGAPLRRWRTVEGAALPPRLGSARTLRRLPVPDSGTNVWIHAATADAIDATQPLVEELSQRHPGIHLLVSTSTASGRESARRYLGDQATVFHHPVDLKAGCLRYLRRLHPRILLLVGDAIRPNLIVAAAELSIPLLLIDGRLPDRLFLRYRRLAPIVRPLIERISHACMQSRQDRERILQLGARRERINWVGDVRFDYTVPEPPESTAQTTEVESFRKRGPDDLFLVCTGIEPGEETILVRLYRRLRQRFPGLRLLLATRRADRADRIASLLGRERVSRARHPRTEPRSDPATPADVLVLDCFKHPTPAQAYRAADLVFIGGSLVPGEGENPIAPAAFGKPILFGPNMRRFGGICRTLIEHYAALRIASPEELEIRLGDLIADPHARRWLGRNARKLIRSNQGSVSRTVAIVRRYLEA